MHNINEILEDNNNDEIKQKDEPQSKIVESLSLNNNAKKISFSLPARLHIKKILQKSLPLILLYESDIISRFIRGYLLSKISIDAFEATTIAYNITYMILYPVPELIAQDTVFISETFGKSKALAKIEDYESASIRELQQNQLNYTIGTLVKQGWLLSLLVSIPSAAILLISNSSLVNIFESPEEVRELAKGYIFAFTFSLPAEFINRISERFMSAIDEEYWLIPYRFLSMSVEIGLNFWLIPRFSLLGAAYSSIGKSFFNLISLGTFFKIKPSFKKFDIYKIDIGDISNLKKILSQGCPILLSQLVITASAYGVTAFIARLGNNRLAIDQTIGLYYTFLLYINMGVSEASNRIVAQYYGAENYPEMRRAGNYSILLNSFLYSIGAIMLNVGSLKLSRLLLNNDEVEEYSTVLRTNFIIVALINLFNVLMDNGRKNLAGTHDTFLGSALPLITTIAFILPLSAISSYLTNFDIYGIAGSIALGSLPGAVTAIGYWLFRSNKVVKSGGINCDTSNKYFSDSCSSTFFSRKRKLHYNKIKDDNSVAANISHDIEIEKDDTVKKSEKEIHI